MRQAGRYLPEYRELRQKHSMLDLITTPELAAEVTLQPLQRFPLDAAIIFADILNPLIGMGAKLAFIEGQGPVIENELREGAAVAKLIVPEVEESVGYTLAALRLVKDALASRNIPVLGFAGAPFTLSTYMIEGRPSKNFVATKRFMAEQGAAWELLQEKLVAYMADYLTAQVRAGAAAVQIFDSALGIVSPEAYEQQVAPYLKHLIQLVRERITAPVIYFAVNSAALFPRFADLGADVIGVDWRMSLGAAESLLGGNYPLQGNLDPALLCGEWQPLESAARRVLIEGRKLPGHIFNLGHGVLPDARIENIDKLVELIQTE